MLFSSREGLQSDELSNALDKEQHASLNNSFLFKSKNSFVSGSVVSDVI